MAAHAHVLLRGRLDGQMAWAAMPVFFFGVGLVDSGDTATHACFLLRGSFNRQLSPEETRGQIEWPKPISFFGIGLIGRTQQMAWAAMPGVVLMCGCVLLSLRDSWVAWVAVSDFLFFGVGLVDSGDTATHAYFLLRLSPEETRGQIEWHGSPSLFASSGSA
ncbi:hypothetical protein N7465_007580 [Penicillium sp. CMV-2018d]|nr:hypothetical protein N7465_007580 [Penicillium sp. CMV-2018d]